MGEVLDEVEASLRDRVQQPPGDLGDPRLHPRDGPRRERLADLAAEPAGEQRLFAVYQANHRALREHRPVVPDVPVREASLSALSARTVVPPVRVELPALGVAADVDQVGVADDGQMELPPDPDRVGWYRFGSRPGEAGSAVLAAHVAYDGVDGVFRRLVDLRPGDGVTVGFADGATQRFVVTDVVQHDKDELPDDLFARDSEPGLALITCGGEFDSDERSYEDNIVAIARPA